MLSRPAPPQWWGEAAQLATRAPCGWAEAALPHGAHTRQTTSLGPDDLLSA